MPQPICATFRSTHWEESPVTDPDTLPRLTRASCRQEYSGGIVGESTLEYLMAYRDGGAASFVGLEVITGKVGERSGSFAVRHEGVFEGGIARMTFSIVPGAGTGDLSRLRGTGQFESPHAPEYEVMLECSFEDESNH